MRSSVSNPSLRRFLIRFYREALVVGIALGLGAFLVERIAGEAGGVLRSLTLLGVGGLLCGLQFSLSRWWR